MSHKEDLNTYTNKDETVENSCLNNQVQVKKWTKKKSESKSMLQPGMQVHSCKPSVKPSLGKVKNKKLGPSLIKEVSNLEQLKFKESMVGFSRPTSNKSRKVL